MSEFFKRGKEVFRLVFPTRLYVICLGISVIMAIVLCFVPLFNILGYESAAFFGVWLGIISTGLTLHAHQNGLLRSPLCKESAKRPLERRPSPVGLFWQMYARNLALVVLPFGILWLNGLRVPNCDMRAGFLFWLLIPVFSILLGQWSAWMALAVAPHKRWLARTIAFGLPLMNAVSLGLHLALEPPIVGHQWWLGYFGGSIYDEAMAIPASLIWYRITNVLLVALGVCGIETLRKMQLGRSYFRLAWVCIALAAVLAVGWSGRQDLGIEIDREYIAEELGGRLETEHFIIYYPLHDSFVEQIERIAEDHEYRFSQLSAFFESDPLKYRGGGKIKSFIYPDREVKGRLMGARNTMIAKLWLHEIHILWRGYGDSLLTHEMAHVFTEPFGAGPLRLSMQRGIGVNMGLVEGIATAADWPVRELTPHETSASLRALEMAPDIRGLLGASGFWTQASGRAYTLMGSFVRYLIDSYGIEKFKQAYPTGDFAAAYGKSADALVGEWELYLDTLTVSAGQLELARYLYDRPSIFGKVCARTIADMRRQADQAVAQGQVLEARAIFEQIIQLDASNSAYQFEYAYLLDRARDYTAALTIVDTLSLDSAMQSVQNAELLSMRGDMQWHLGQFEMAEKSYAQCLTMNMPIDMERHIRVKHAVVSSPDETTRSLGYQYLLGRGSSDISLYFAMEWLRREPEDRLASYLVGRKLWAAHQYKEAVPFLESVAGGMQAEVLDAEAYRMLGQSYFFVGRFDEAQRSMEALQSVSKRRYDTQAEEWMSRINWKRNRNSLVAN